jgi:hypothetical protein
MGGGLAEIPATAAGPERFRLDARTGVFLDKYQFAAFVRITPTA